MVEELKDNLNDKERRYPMELVTDSTTGVTDLCGSRTQHVPVATTGRNTNRGVRGARGVAAPTF